MEQEHTAVYQVIETNRCLEGQEYVSYGIRCEDEIIEDITTERDKLECLAEQCNRLGLDIIHFKDVVEDFLCE